MTDKLKVACIGAGYFSRFQYDAWDRNPRSEVIAAANRTISSLESLNIPQVFSNITDMLDACDPDILDIITPPETHLEAIKIGISKGVKWIICQKPFCTSIDEAKKAIALAEASDTQIIVHENFRFQPWFRAMRKVVDSGDLGDIHNLTMRMRPADGQGPDAYLARQPYFQTMPRLLIHETGVHWVDTFKYLLGSPKAVYGDLRKMNPVIAGEDAGYFILDYEDGARALFDGNRLLDHAAEDCRFTFGHAWIEGTKGVVSFDGSGEVVFRPFGKLESKTILPKQDWQGFAGDCVYALQDHIVAGILDGGELENLAQDYISVIEIEELIYLSSEMGRKLKV